MRNYGIEIFLYSSLFISNLLDWFSTYLALTVGATEYNFFYNYFNMNIWTFLIFKIILIIFYMFLMFFLLDTNNGSKYHKQIYIFMVLLSLGFIYLFINNILVFNNMK